MIECERVEGAALDCKALRCAILYALDGLWNGEASERAIIDHLRQAYGLLGLTWTPPPSREFGGGGLPDCGSAGLLLPRAPRFSLRVRAKLIAAALRGRP